MLLSTLQSKIDSISINPNDYPTRGEYHKMITHRNTLIEKYNAENKINDAKRYDFIAVEYGKKWSDVVADYEKRKRKQLTQEQIEWIENEYRTNPDLILFRDSGNEDVDLSNYLLD
jgi:hypothetical protein